MARRTRAFPAGLPCALLAACLFGVLAPRTGGADEVRLRNGDRLSGRITSMADGKLRLKTPWGEAVTIRWEEIAALRTDAPIPVQLVDGTLLRAALDRDEKQPGVARARGESLMDATRIELAKVVALNPPKHKAVKYSGNLTAGANIYNGNTRTTNANASANFVARSKRLRLTIKGAWNYTEDRALEELTARSAQAAVKLDFFATEKLYTYAQASFLGDKFRDFNLRSVFGIGFGVQWFETEHLSFSTESGVSHVNEDRRVAKDTRQVSGRVAWDFNWDIVVDQVEFFHHGELYPSFEDSKDIFFQSQTGMRFTIWKGFFASTQINYQYDTKPSAGFRKFDVAYILGLGYGFNL